MTHCVIYNAKVKSTTLGSEDHGVLYSFLHLDYGDGGQGFGGYCLYNPSGGKDMCGKWIWRILETLEVTDWSKLPGTYCRADVRDGLVYRIGHILKDQWFCPEEDLVNTEPP